MKICTIGNGFVTSHLDYELIDSRLETDSKQIANVLDKFKPDVLINCIGKTGRPNIDWCESHKEETASINTALPILLAEECAKKSIHLIHIGSGCIFFGASPNQIYSHMESNSEINGYSMIFTDTGWREDDFANPKSFYSKTKWAADLALADTKATVLRIRMPISIKNNQRNIINKLRGYSQIIDIPNSMTFMDDLVRCIAWVAKEGHTGIFHVTNPEPITAAQIMSEYKKYIPSHNFSIINESELDKLTIAKRSNCLLDTNKLYDKGFQMTPSQEALTKCMSEYVKTI